MHELMERLFELTQTPWGVWGMVLHAFLESFIMPIPHDVFLATMSLSQPKYSFLFALLSTTASTLGNMVGYAIGKYGGKPVIEKMIRKELLAGAKQLIDKYDGWATFVACFTPFPDKVFSLCAGFFTIAFLKFAMIVFIARGCRFFFISGLLFFYGEAVHGFLLEHTNSLMVAVVVLTAAGLIAWKIFNYLLLKSRR